MRIDTLSIFRQALSAITDQQGALARTQLEVATGRKLHAPSDDPIGAGRVLEITRAKETLATYDRTASSVGSRLAQMESSLQTTNDLLQRVRELAVQAGDDALTNDQRGFLATEINQSLQQLLLTANGRDSRGDYLFSGFKVRTKPFSRSGDTVTYEGDQGQRFQQIGPSRRVADSDPGSAIFMNILNGNGSFATRAAVANTGTGIVSPGSVVDPTLYNGESYTIQFTSPTDYDVLDSGGAVVQSGVYQEGGVIAVGGIELSITGVPATGDEFTVSPSVNQDVFTTVISLVNALEAPVTDAVSRTELHNALNYALTDIDRSVDHFLDARADIGARLNAVDLQVDVNEGASIVLEQTRSDIEDVNVVEAVSRLSVQANSLEAAQQSFVRVQQLSLFNYLR